jgi:uncharacterized protein (TIGR00369 family)
MSDLGHPDKPILHTERELSAADVSSANGWGARRSKQVTWHDPMAAARQGVQLSGREFLQGIIDGRFPPPPIAELFEAQLVSIGDGEAVFRCTPDESAYNPIGMVHGGWLCTLMDSAAGCAVHTRLPAGVGYSSIEIKVSFLKAIQADRGPIELGGRALRVGRNVAFAEAHATNAAGDLVGHATSSVAVLRP